MDAGSARREVIRAAKLRRRVPFSHPYGVAPLWTPYWLARAIGRLCAALEGRGSPRRPVRPAAPPSPRIVLKPLEPDTPVEAPTGPGEIPRHSKTKGARITLRL